MKVGFLGLGLMGAPMAARLVEASHDVRVNSRRRATAQQLLTAGARWADNPAACADGADLAILMLPTVAAVEEVVFGSDGVLAADRLPRILIDMSTTAPALSERIAAELADRGVAALDAPVSGSSPSAIAGTLSIMVGGDPATFGTAEPVLCVLGSPRLLGPAGTGQRVKLLNQILVANISAGIAEAWTLCRTLGVDPDTVLAALGGGLAGGPLLQFMWPRLAAGDFAPGFKIDQMRKDLGLALEEADRHGVDLLATSAVADRYARISAAGGGSLGTQALAQDDSLLGPAAAQPERT